MSLVHLLLRAFLITSMLGASVAQSAEPRKGGTLVFGRGGDSVTLDPALATDGESLNVTDHLFDGLVTFKPGTTEVIPALAEKWNISNGGKTYTFSLRKGVLFHDGTKFNADAVVFSFMRQHDKKHRAAKYGGPYTYYTAMGLNRLIKSIKKKDDFTVEFNLTKPNAPFLSTLGMQSFAIVSPAALMKHKKEFARNPVGTGPFKLLRWEKNQKIVMRAFDKHWNGEPYLKTLIFRAIKDNNTRLQEMMAGNIHVMDNPDSHHISTLKKRLKDKVVFKEMAGFNVGYLALNMEKKPFNDVRVRRAISHAINKKSIIDSVYAGYAVAAKNPMPPTLWGYNNKVPEYEYNPKKAKKLLKEAGLTKGFATTIWAMPVPRPYMPDGRKVAEAIQADLAVVGIKAKIVSYDWGTYLHKTKYGEHDMALLGWTGDIGDPDNFLYVLLDKDNASKPAQNISFYKSDALHKLLVAAQVETDVKKRIDLYKKAQMIIHEDAPMVPIAHSTVVLPMRKSVTNFTMDPTGRRSFPKVWLER